MYRRGEQSRRRAWLIKIAVLVAAVTVIALLAFYNRGAPNPIPPEIQGKLTFSPFVVSGKSDSISVTDYKFSTAEGNVPILSYVIRIEGIKVSASQYPEPAEFTDIPEYKDRFLNNVVQRSSSVQTAGGVISIGHLSKNTSQQLGVLNEKSLLVFMTPERSLSQKQWHTLGDHLEIQKLNH